MTPMMCVLSGLLSHLCISSMFSFLQVAPGEPLSLQPCLLVLGSGSSLLHTTKPPRRAPLTALGKAIQLCIMPTLNIPITDDLFLFKSH